MLVTETFHGYIETTQDVLLIFEGCRRGLLPRICRRLQEKERNMIRSGSIFVFDERESGIKRWTDGRVWSPSRILGNFLIYRELDKKIPGDKRLSGSSNGGRSFSVDGSIIDKHKERQLVGSLSDSYKFKEDGLIKKTMSITINGVAQHLISYYNPQEVLEDRLRSPSSVPELASLEISPELLVKQNFRIPPFVEPTFDHQPYRSMSIGSHITSSPSTPMLPQHRQPYHQRHYSVSSFNIRSYDGHHDNPIIQMNTAINTTNGSSNSNSSNSSISSNHNNVYDQQALIDNTTNNNSNERPNLGQLLNPVHPLHTNERDSMGLSSYLSTGTT
ncbi:Putative cAMP-independent regulatory protein [Rhizopus microsporus]|nr:Putative cAMP-independent regulatory protein [Rhizopus microsporus]